MDRLARGLLTELRSQAPEAALASAALPTTMRTSLDVSTAGQTWTPLAYNWVSGGYFELLRTPILSGRPILDTDDRRSLPIAVVNQSAAKMLWPGENPIGHKIRIRGESADREVAGMVQDSRFRPLGVAEADQPCVFLPLLQTSTTTNFEIHVRTAGPPLRFTGSLRQIAARLAPEASLADILTLDQQAESGLKPMETAAQATGAVSVLGILLALAGMFAACAYRIAQQKKEIAIRLAIGAQPGRVIRSFASRGLWIGLGGACLGLLPALWGVRLLRASVTGTGAPDARAFAIAGGALTLACAIAAFSAARRISHVQPSDALRVQ